MTYSQMTPQEFARQSAAEFERLKAERDAKVAAGYVLKVVEPHSGRAVWVKKA